MTIDSEIQAKREQVADLREQIQVAATQRVNEQGQAAKLARLDQLDLEEVRLQAELKAIQAQLPAQARDDGPMARDEVAQPGAVEAGEALGDTAVVTEAPEGVPFEDRPAETAAPYIAYDEFGRLAEGSQDPNEAQSPVGDHLPAEENVAAAEELPAPPAPDQSRPRRR